MLARPRSRTGAAQAWLAASSPRWARGTRVRVQARPTFKASAPVHFESFEQGARAVRALSQAGLYPSNCRLLDPTEAAITGSAGDGRALLLLGFESADHPIDPWMARAQECCRDHGGDIGESKSSDGVGTWRQAFLQAPYLRA